MQGDRKKPITIGQKIITKWEEVAGKSEKTLRAYGPMNGQNERAEFV